MSKARDPAEDRPVIIQIAPNESRAEESVRNCILDTLQMADEGGVSAIGIVIAGHDNSVMVRYTLGEGGWAALIAGAEQLKFSLISED